MKEEFTMGLDH